MLRTFTLRETVLLYLREANLLSPTVLQAATRENSIDDFTEVNPSPIVCSCNADNTEYVTSGLGLLNGLLRYCDESVIKFQKSSEDMDDPTIIKIE